MFFSNNALGSKGRLTIHDRFYFNADALKRRESGEMES
jgi:hypothetical protein